MFLNPETSSRVTLASLGTVFQIGFVVLWSCCLVVLLAVSAVVRTNKNGGDMENRIEKLWQKEK